jgi:hypothetical protein
VAMILERAPYSQFLDWEIALQRAKAKIGQAPGTRSSLDERGHLGSYEAFSSGRLSCLLNKSSGVLHT